MKAKALLLFLLVVVFAAISFTAAAQDVAREDTVVFDIDGPAGAVANFDQMNWMLPNSHRNKGLHQAVSEPLFILNYETGEIMPWLAESMTANDALDVWTLNLREGAAWSDGEPFNSEDVVFTISLLLNDETSSLNNAGNVQTWVESVEAVNDLTVVFNLQEPNPRFQLDFFSVRIWGGINMLPEHVWNDKDPFTFKFFDPEQGWPLGTGPYVITSANETTWVYDRNDDWWGAKTGVFKLPEPQRAIWVVTGNDQIRTTMAVSNELDSIMDVTLGAFEAMQAANDNIFAWVEGMPFVWLDPCPRQLSFQTQVAPWDNPEMRWAINHAISRQQVIDIAYEGVTIPSRTLYVEYGGMFPYIDAIEDAGMSFNTEADLDAAAALLENNGYSRNDDGRWVDGDGNALSLEIQVHEGFIEKRRITTNLVEQLQTFGIEATAGVIAGATWNDNKRFGNYEATTDWDACGSINEPWASLDRYTSRWWVPIGEFSSGSNHVRWDGPNNEAYSELVGQLGSLPLGHPDAIDLVVEAYGYLYEDLPFIPLNQATKLIPFNSTYWEGWPTSENNWNHPATWWQSTHQFFQEIHKAGM
jgi:peptide/nickel transport system substrate-binding protein